MTADDEIPGVEADGLSPRDARLAVLIASGKSYEEAGRAVGVSKATVFRVAKESAFRRAIDEVRDAAISTGLGLLFHTFSLATEELAKLCKGGTAQDNVRLGACRTVVETVIKVRDLELVRRVAILEERLAQRENAGNLEALKAKLRSRGFNVDRNANRAGGPDCPVVVNSESPVSPNSSSKNGDHEPSSLFGR